MTADPRSFSRFQRILLGTDGTVTHLLEAYTGEPIEVVKLLQAFDTAARADADLDLPPDEKVLRRQVVLRSRHSHENLLHAEAVVAAGRVEPAFLARLLETDRPIGVLLGENRTETFREILRVGREPAGPLAAHFSLDPADELIWRTYRIVARRQPIILITERFPPGLFRVLPQ